MPTVGVKPAPQTGPDPTDPTPTRDHEAERAPVKRLALKLWEATQEGDAETFTVSISDPFRFGRVVLTRAKAREAFLQSYSSGIGAGGVRAQLKSIDVWTGVA